MATDTPEIFAPAFFATSINPLSAFPSAKKSSIISKLSSGDKNLFETVIV